MFENMKRIIWIFVLAFFSAKSVVMAQLTSDEMKIYKKCEKLYKKKKYSEAATKFQPVMQEHMDKCNVWAAYLKYKQAEYVTSKTMNVTVTGIDANSALVESLNQIFKDMPKQKYIGALKSSVLFCEENDIAHIHLRSLIIDKRNNPDTGLDDKAWENYGKAEEYFGQKNYDESIKYFKKALQLEPGFYSAKVHMGDCYYAKMNYKKAAEIFAEAIAAHPNMLEAHKYLADAYDKMEENAKAQNAILEGIKCYPSPEMFHRLGKALGSESAFNRGWIARGADINTFSKNLYLETVEPEGAWKTYANAKDEISKFTDSLYGIINKENSLTKSKYMEVYCWEKMLQNTKDKEFDYAKKMQSEGFLECYVLIAMFHVDLYDQQQDFVKSNPEKVQQYLEYLVKENK